MLNKLLALFITIPLVACGSIYTPPTDSQTASIIVRPYKPPYHKGILNYQPPDWLGDISLATPESNGCSILKRVLNKERNPVVSVPVVGNSDVLFSVMHTSTNFYCEATGAFFAKTGNEYIFDLYIQNESKCVYSLIEKSTNGKENPIKFAPAKARGGFSEVTICKTREYK